MSGGQIKDSWDGYKGYIDVQVVDQTVTSGTNGLRMPYCDKAQRSAVGLVA